MMDGEPIFCPTCGRAHPSSERFCETCRMPLVNPAGAEDPAGSERRRAARKIKPEYAEGELVKVAHADDLAQAEFIAGLLLEEGIPSMLRGSIAGYAPLVDPRDIMVPQSGAQAAREALAFNPDAR
jgi:hypothetical protein